MFEPLRFLHVAEAGLDRPLGDLGPLPEALGPLAEDATLIAFDQMIGSAIAQNVDFVLLAGNTFREADQSLRARIHLRDGLRELDDQGIAAFVLPGICDPASAWRAIPDLPENVTLLNLGDAEEEEPETPVAVLREGRVIATITAGTLSQLSAGTKPEPNPEHEGVGLLPSQNGHARSLPFRIGLLSAWPAESVPQSAHDLPSVLSACGCDYLAVPLSDVAARERGWDFEAGQTLHTTDGIAHHPGRLQALSAHETGPHGGTLIEVDHAGEIRGTFLPFAFARLLRFEINVPPHAGWEDLAQTLSALLAAETSQAGEGVWFVSWVLFGEGPFSELWKDSSLQQKLIAALPAFHPQDDSLPIHHQLNLQESSPPGGAKGSSRDLERLYREALDELAADNSAILPSLREAVRADIGQLKDPDWQRRLLPLVADLEAAAIIAPARMLGSQWFSLKGQGAEGERDKGS